MAQHRVNEWYVMREGSMTLWYGRCLFIRDEDYWKTERPFMPTLIYGRHRYLRATEWWCYGNIECLHPPSTDVNTRPHYDGKGMKDHRVELADEKTVCVYDYMVHTTEWSAYTSLLAGHPTMLRLLPRLRPARLTEVTEKSMSTTSMTYGVVIKSSYSCHEELTVRHMTYDFRQCLWHTAWWCGLTSHVDLREGCKRPTRTYYELR